MLSPGLFASFFFFLSFSQSDGRRLPCNWWLFLVRCRCHFGFLEEKIDLKIVLESDHHFSLSKQSAMKHCLCCFFFFLLLCVCVCVSVVCVRLYFSTLDAEAALEKKRSFRSLWHFPSLTFFKNHLTFRSPSLDSGGDADGCGGPGSYSCPLHAKMPP